MFKEYIGDNDSPFLSESVFSLFANKENAYNCYVSGIDNSLCSTIRALLINRLDKIDEREKLSVNVLNGQFSVNRMSTFESPDEALAYYNRTVWDFTSAQNNTLTIMNVPEFTEQKEAALKKMFRADCMKDYEEVNKISQFFQKSFRVLCFMNKSAKRTILFVESIDLRRFHFIQSGIFAYMPWLFSKNDRFTDDELNLVKSLASNNVQDYLRYLNNIYKKSGIKDKMIDSLLGKFETNEFVRKIQELEQQIDSWRHDIASLSDRIGQLIDTSHNAEIQILGYQTKMNEYQCGEFAEYFRSRNGLELLNANNRTIEFITSGKLEIFDEDLAEKLVKNHQSTLYANSVGPRDKVQRLFEHIFIKKDFYIQCCSKWSIMLHRSVNGCSHTDFGHAYDKYLPNPHIQGFSCDGSYRPIFNQLLQSGDYIMIIEQCFASNATLAMGDATVVKLFSSMLFSITSSGKYRECIVLPNGNVVNWKDAIDYIIKQEGETDDE